jgi:elongation factor Ts
LSYFDSLVEWLVVYQELNSLTKIIEGRLNGWFKDRVLLEQNYVKDEKQTIQQFLNGATITSYAQVVIGG